MLEECTQTYVKSGGVPPQKSGLIINISSYSTSYAGSQTSTYRIAKLATDKLAIELAKGPITVNAVCPGYTETEIALNAIANIQKSGKTEAEARAILTRGNPQGRLVQPEEIAATVAWLCLPSSRAVTGQSVAVAGGEVM